MARASKNRDWSQYNTAAKKSGEITFYVSQEVLNGWLEQEKSGKRGASTTYSHAAIEMCLTLRAAYNLPLRRACGFITSILKSMDLKLPCPDFSTLSRRAKHLNISIGRIPTQGGIVIAVDSTGVKVYGEGEWKVRQHGADKRRTWLKLHTAVNVENMQIESFELTQNNVADSEVAPRLIEAINAPIRKVTGDGAYDAETVYQSAEQVGAIPIIPPRRGAKLQKPTSAISAKIPRDVAISYINKHGADELARSQWKKETGYHVRSLAETGMYRMKVHFGSSVRSRTFANQKTEIAIKIKILNRIAALGTFCLNRTDAIAR